LADRGSLVRGLDRGAPDLCPGLALDLALDPGPDPRPWPRQSSDQPGLKPRQLAPALVPGPRRRHWPGSADLDRPGPEQSHPSKRFAPLAKQIEPTRATAPSIRR